MLYFGATYHLSDISCQLSPHLYESLVKRRLMVDDVGYAHCIPNENTYSLLHGRSKSKSVHPDRPPLVGNRYML